MISRKLKLLSSFTLKAVVLWISSKNQFLINILIIQLHLVNFCVLFYLLFNIKLDRWWNSFTNSFNRSLNLINRRWTYISFKWNFDLTTEGSYTILLTFQLYWRKFINSNKKFDRFEILFSSWSWKINSNCFITIHWLIYI